MFIDINLISFLLLELVYGPTNKRAARATFYIHEFSLDFPIPF